MPYKDPQKRKEQAARYREENREHVQKLNRAWREQNKDYVQTKDKENYEKGKLRRLESQKKYRDSHKEKLSADGKTWRAKRPTYGHEYYKRTAKKTIWKGCKIRAAAKELPFNITVEDIVIPDVCPVLGIPVFHQERRKLSDNSPSVDKIIPALGYVRGNIRVISLRANMLKRNGTASELIKVARYAYDETQRVRRELGV